jgi:uncharacterized protein YeaO (DUF488 family)
MRETERALRIRVKRAYEAPAGADGYRTLVDRAWPRGVFKDALRLDDWVKDIAPSPGMRRWFGHDPEKWSAFKDLYFRELDERPDAVAALLVNVRGETLTLIFGAKDVKRNNAVALKQYLDRRTEKRPRVA